MTAEETAIVMARTSALEKRNLLDCSFSVADSTDIDTIEALTGLGMMTSSARGSANKIALRSASEIVNSVIRGIITPPFKLIVAGGK